MKGQGAGPEACGGGDGAKGGHVLKLKKSRVRSAAFTSDSSPDLTYHSSVLFT